MEIKNVIFDMDDVKEEVESRTIGSIIEHEKSIVFKLANTYLDVDITDCIELPLKFDFKKSFKTDCEPDTCIKKNIRTCKDCKFQLTSNMVGFQAEFLHIIERENRKFAIYKLG